MLAGHAFSEISRMSILFVGWMDAVGPVHGFKAAESFQPPLSRHSYHAMGGFAGTPARRSPGFCAHTRPLADGRPPFPLERLLPGAFCRFPTLPPEGERSIAIRKQSVNK